jgi:hypothetical protein
MVRADAIALAFSADDGVTWSAPAKVNATPTNIPVGNQQAFAANLAVASDGQRRHRRWSTGLPRLGL